MKNCCSRAASKTEWYRAHMPAIVAHTFSMKQIEKWRWRHRWAGKMVDGKLYYTEAEIRARHPEAVSIEGSMKVFEVPETPEEIAAAERSITRAPNREFRSDGPIKKMWEK